jgi:hypothetical protein
MSVIKGREGEETAVPTPYTHNKCLLLDLPAEKYTIYKFNVISSKGIPVATIQIKE